MRVLRVGLAVAVSVSGPSALAGGVDAAAHAATAAHAAAARQPAYSTHRAGYRDHVAFTVTYRGSGSFATTYHATPPNPGGPADTNDASDSSTQRWSLTFRRALAISLCAPARRSADPCRHIGTLVGATGSSSAVGRVAHRHVDGLFSTLNSSISCRVSIRTPPNDPLHASVAVRYLPGRRAVMITALDPVIDALADLPSQCPGQGDPLDGLYDNYYTPGFSFSAKYGPERWFKAQTVMLPLAILHRSSRIDIPVSNTAKGTPPRDCAVAFPAYERCRTGGIWSGLLRLTLRRPGRTRG